MALIKEGKDFEEVAKQYSDSSSIGVVEEGQFLPDIEKIVFSLTQGQVSDSVETDKGIFIFKLKGGSRPRWLNSKRSRTRSTICSTARNSRNVLSNGWAICTKRPMSRSSNNPKFCDSKICPEGCTTKSNKDFVGLSREMPSAFPGFNPGDLQVAQDKVIPDFSPHHLVPSQKFGIPRKAGQTRREFVLAASRCRSRRIFLSKNPG